MTNKADRLKEQRAAREIVSIQADKITELRVENARLRQRIYDLTTEQIIWRDANTNLRLRIDQMEAERREAEGRAA